MLRILVADAQQVVRRGLRKIIEDQRGWAVVGEAGDGKAAVTTAIEVKPDVAIVDYALPLLSGIEVTRQIRARLPRTEILMFTMHESDSLVGEILQAGARAYVLKTERCDHIVAAIKALAQHRMYLSGAWSERLLEGFLDKVSKNGSVLSPKERVIVQLIAEGRSNKEMSRILNLSVKTVETQRAMALQKLHIKTTADLVRYAIRNQIIAA
jgi:DNA-binding NarL/FixJ family response regulator